jgi:hypothetical protein
LFSTNTSGSYQICHQYNDEKEIFHTRPFYFCFDIFISGIVLSATDLWTVWFSCFTDMDALPISPDITFSFDARNQSRIKIYTIVDPVNYRIFLGTPVRFHVPGFWVYP